MDKGMYTVDGYASIFNVPDQLGDVVVPGAFRDSFSQEVPVLWQHCPNIPIGRLDHMVEDHRGLRVRLLICQGTQIGQEVISLIRSGVIQGLSVGYTVKQALKGSGGVRRRLTALNLKEISLVTFPAHPLARILSS